MCFVPLDLRVSLKFMISSEQFFKTNFQATLFFSIAIGNCCEEPNTAFNSRLSLRMKKFRLQLFGFLAIF